MKWIAPAAAFLGGATMSSPHPVAELEEAMNDAMGDAYRLGQKEALEWLDSHASGGGSWRRLIVMKLAELNREERK